VCVLDVSNAQPQFAKLTLDGQLQGPQKFSDGVHVNGRIYLVPFSSSHICVLDIRSPEAIQDSPLVFENMPVSETKWSGSVLADNGKIYFAPYSLTDVGIFDSSTLQFTIALYGILFADRMNFGRGILGANGKMYFEPYFISEMHESDPSENALSQMSSPQGNFFAMNADFNSTISGTVLARNGNIYCIPSFHMYMNSPAVPAICTPGTQPTPTKALI